MKQKHHFLLLRHCVRSTSSGVNVGTREDGSTYSSRLRDYMDVDLPNWQVGEFDCVAGGQEMVENTGHWLIESGVIDPHAKVKWEIISDASFRDVTTAYYLTEGIQDALDSKNRQRDDPIVSIGRGDIRVDERFFDDICDQSTSSHIYTKEAKERFETLPRPSMSFKDALNLMEELVGVGKVGRLVDNVQVEPTFDGDDWNLEGAATLVDSFAATLFYARAGNIEPVFIPRATKQQIYQLLEFHYWYRSVLEVGNSWSAKRGAMQVQAMLHTLRYGYYQQDKVDTSNTAEPYDTSVTIILGHDEDLNTMATALGARWTLQEPYLSGPDGAFVPTPPVSGIHAIRDVASDRVDLSFVYPVYSSQGQSSSFHHNMTGILEHTPLLFQEEIPFAKVNDQSTSIGPSNTDSVSSLDTLEEYVLSVLSGYERAATTCYHQAAEYWAATPSPPASDGLVNVTTTTTTSYKKPADTDTPEENAVVVPLAIFAGCLASVVILFLIKSTFRNKRRLPASAAVHSPMQHQPVRNSEDKVLHSHTDEESTTNEDASTSGEFATPIVIV